MNTAPPPEGARTVAEGEGTAVHRLARPWPIEGVVLAATAAFVALLNQPFWQAALAGRSAADATTWRFAACAALVMTGLQALPLLLIATRHTVKPLLALLVVTGVVAQYMMARYGVVLDPGMLRNTLRTDPAEAGDLLTLALFGQLALAAVLVALAWRLPLRRRPWRRALAWRAGTVVAVLALTVAALLAGFQDIASTLRNDKGLRYRITPANVLYSGGRALSDDLRVARRAPPPLVPIQQLASGPHRPRLLVMVVGETARAMNFSLNGYARPTNPRLAALPVINFPDTTSCGTSTEVSLPCMFSPGGRADYDEDVIRSGESLPQLAARAGLRVVWLDNQSGCKGVCNGVDTRDLTRGLAATGAPGQAGSTAASDPALCPGGACLDGVLVQGLRQVIGEAEASGDRRDTLVLLHQMGNHGPAYYKRYPADAAPFGPACAKAELRDCSRDEIVNAYDNAIAYTDRVLADVIGELQSRQGRWDVGFMYASDHGESLGEHGLYLHGMPESIAPREQHAVPMLWWFGGGGAAGWDGLDAGCLRARATAPAHHDHLYHSVLGLFELRTPQYVAARDLISPCRGAAMAGTAAPPPAANSPGAGGRTIGGAAMAKVP